MRTSASVNRHRPAARLLRSSRAAFGALCRPLLLGVILTAISDAAHAQPANEADDVTRVAARIDEQIRARWEAEGITPAAAADDAEFLRRVYLDIAGRIPSVAEARAFLDDAAPDKRRRLVAQLVNGPGYVVHFTRLWGRVLLPEAETDFQARFLLPGFETWLRQQLVENRPYDELVYELLTAPLQGNSDSPAAFFQAKDVKPENLAAATSRIFLGIRLECAQCHNHPFDDWTREQFWQFAAFYEGIERTNRRDGVLGQLRELFARRGLTIPETDRVVTAAFLDGSRPARSSGSLRPVLAEWITSAENPYFARMAVNRLWAHFFGTGLVDPVDDFSEANPPSHPELLDELAAALVRHEFDLKFLIRAITATAAYQRTSAAPPGDELDPRLFARMTVRGLTADQMVRSVAQATGDFEPFVTRRYVFSQSSTPRSELEELFDGHVSPPPERETTVLQALAMMNGSFVADATSLERSRTLAAVADFPRFDMEDRIETLYLATLSRRPRPDELARCRDYVQRAGDKTATKRALADIFWALLNCSEFCFNH